MIGFLLAISLSTSQKWKFKASRYHTQYNTSYISTIADVEDPVFANIPNDKTQSTDPGLPTSVVSWTEPTASDNSGSVTQTSSHNPGDVFPIGDTVVTYTAVDPYGNSKTKSFVVTVEGESFVSLV